MVRDNLPGGNKWEEDKTFPPNDLTSVEPYTTYRTGFDHK